MKLCKFCHDVAANEIVTITPSTVIKWHVERSSVCWKTSETPRWMGERIFLDILIKRDTIVVEMSAK